MKLRRGNNRTMCAELLTVQWRDDEGHSRSEEATLEDISVTGACVKLQHSIPLDTPVALHYPKGKYEGRIIYCTYQTTGYFIGIAFDDGYRWSKADFHPSYVFEVPVLTGPTKAGRD